MLIKETTGRWEVSLFVTCPNCKEDIDLTYYENLSDELYNNPAKTGKCNKVYNCEYCKKDFRLTQLTI